MLYNVKCLQELIGSTKTFSDLLEKLRSSVVCVSGHTFICKGDKEDDVRNKLRALFDNARSKLVKSCEKKITADYHWCYGVYIVWKVIGDIDEEVIYIGKSGTVSNSGSYKGQNVYGRLANAPRGNNNARNNNQGNNTQNNTKGIKWLLSLIKKYEAIKVEVLCLDIKYGNETKPELFSPGLIEALLLQYYLWENGRLPRENYNL